MVPRSSWNEGSAPCSRAISHTFESHNPSLLRVRVSGSRMRRFSFNCSVSAIRRGNSSSRCALVKIITPSPLKLHLTPGNVFSLVVPRCAHHFVTKGAGGNARVSYPLRHLCRKIALVYLPAFTCRKRVLFIYTRTATRELLPDVCRTLPFSSRASQRRPAGSQDTLREANSLFITRLKRDLLDNSEGSFHPNSV